MLFNAYNLDATDNRSPNNIAVGDATNIALVYMALRSGQKLMTHVRFLFYCATYYEAYGYLSSWILLK